MLRFLTAGESHGPALTAILDGMPAGLPLDASIIDHELARRQKGYGSGGRMKIEKDAVRILSGVMAGETIGAPIGLLVENADHVKWKGKAVEPLTAPRPGHADLTGAVKYGYRDLRPTLERSSARETTMRVAAGAVCKHFLSQFGILVGGYVKSIGEVEADLTGDYQARFEAAEKNDVRCPDPVAAEKMRARIEEIIHGKDTLGGIIEIVALEPAGRAGFLRPMGPPSRSPAGAGGAVGAGHEGRGNWRCVR
jgi:chorismate synthase